jgi:hypothetical protein
MFYAGKPLGVGLAIGIREGDNLAAGVAYAEISRCVGTLSWLFQQLDEWIVSDNIFCPVIGIIVDHQDFIAIAWIFLIQQ